MNILYEGKDITHSAEVKRADICDNANGVADSIDLMFTNTKNQWSDWKPQKGDSIIVKHEGFTSGKTFIRAWEQCPGEFSIKATSAPLVARSNETRVWEGIRFSKLSGDIASALGLEVQMFSVKDWTYDRVEQREERGLKLLQRLCIREGYALKITDSKVVIYDERTFEQYPPAASIYSQELIGDYKFTSKSDKLYSKCTVRCITSNGQLLQAEYSAPGVIGGVLKITEQVTSQAEAERFARAYLRYANKNETTGHICIKLNPNIAAGNTVEISGVGLADGIYFVEKAVHRLTLDKTLLMLRKPLEGY